jgi:hypothetical protein
VDTNIVTILDRSGSMERLPKMAKDRLAHIILERGLSIYKQKNRII